MVYRFIDLLHNSRTALLFIEMLHDKSFDKVSDKIFKREQKWIVQCTHFGMGMSPTNAWKSMWIKKVRLPRWSSRGQQVSHQRWIWEIHCTQAMKHTSEGSTLTLKARVDVSRGSKQGYQCPHKKDQCPPKSKEMYIYEIRRVSWCNTERVFIIQVPSLSFQEKLQFTIFSH